MDGRPDARAQVRADGRAAGLLVGRQDLAEARSCRRPGRRPGARAACACPASTMATSRSGADAAEEPGDRLERALRGADRPIRWSRRRVVAGAGARAARGSGRGGRHACVPAIAWTSSTMTCSTPRSISRAWLVSSRYRLSGVVMRMSGGCRASSRRSSAGVSPVAAGDGDPRRLVAQPLGRQPDARSVAPAGCARRRRSGP